MLDRSYFIKISVFSTCRPLRGQDGPVDQVRGEVQGGDGDALKTCPWTQNMDVPSLVEIGARMWICIAYIQTHTHTDRQTKNFIFIDYLRPASRARSALRADSAQSGYPERGSGNPEPQLSPADDSGATLRARSTLRADSAQSGSPELWKWQP